MEAHPSSAAAFVEGGIQEASQDLCSVCLELFSDNNPITVTSCKHGYHLQCILEWAQRSKECPMCWQPLSLEDPNSQELLDAVEREKFVMASSVLRRHSTGGFEFQVPAFANDSDFEQRIMRHLAVAARAHHFATGESLCGRGLSTHGHPQLVMVPTTHSPISSAAGQGASFSKLGAIGPSREHSVRPTSDRHHIALFSKGGVDAGEEDSGREKTEPEYGEENQQKSVLSEIVSISETLKSRFAAASLRYKETLSRSTKGLRERLRVQTNETSDIGARARDMGVGVGRALERISPMSYAKRKVEEDETCCDVLNMRNECESSSSGNSGNGKSHI